MPYRDTRRKRGKFKSYIAQEATSINSTIVVPSFDPCLVPSSNLKFMGNVDVARGGGGGGGGWQCWHVVVVALSLIL